MSKCYDDFEDYSREDLVDAVLLAEGTADELEATLKELEAYVEGLEAKLKGYEDA